MRQSWLNSGLQFTTELQDDAIRYPVVVCDDSDIILFAFDPNIGWSAHVFSSITLKKRFQQVSSVLNYRETYAAKMTLAPKIYYKFKNPQFLSNYYETLSK